MWEHAIVVSWRLVPGRDVSEPSRAPARACQARSSVSKLTFKLGLGELGKMKLELGSSKARAWVRLLQGVFETQV